MNRIQNFDQTINGKKTQLFILTNDNGVEAQITNYGAALVSFKFPDKNGVIQDVVLGFDHVGDYQQDQAFLGVIAGRYANRIGSGKFQIDDNEYQLEKNDGDNTLHGGFTGFGNVIWEAKQQANKLSLYHTSPDGNEGFPGNLNTVVTYELKDNNDLVINYKASTDKATYVNLTNHAYFNLGGHASGNIEKHVLKINASKITEKDNFGIPTGRFINVEDSPLNFLKPKEIGQNIKDAHPQMDVGVGYDHNYVVDETNDELQAVAQVYLPETGICLDVLSTFPGVQFYSGDHLGGGPIGKNGHPYESRDGFCLESQYYPDSPHHDNFPSTLLEPGQEFKEQTIYRFSLW